MAEWINSDGLRVRFGTDEASVTRGGELPTNGDFINTEFVLTLSQAGVNSGLVPNTYGIVFPAGAFIEEVVVIPETAAAGTNAVLNVGLVRTNTTTTYDEDAFIAALPTTSMDTVGETTVLRQGSTYAGSAIGTTLAYPGVLVFDYTTAAFTDGVIRVIVRSYVKRPAVTNS